MSIWSRRATQQPAVLAATRVGRGAEQRAAAVVRPLRQGEEAVAKRSRGGAYCCRSPLQYRHIAAGDPPKSASHIASVAHVPIYEIGSRLSPSTPDRAA